MFHHFSDQAKLHSQVERAENHQDRCRHPAGICLSSRCGHIIRFKIDDLKSLKPKQFQAIFNLWPPGNRSNGQAKKTKTFRRSLCRLGTGPGQDIIKMISLKLIFFWRYSCLLMQGTVEEDEMDEGSKHEVERSAQEANMDGMQNIQVWIL